MTSQPRTPAGSPEGGQFAGLEGAESGSVLTAPDDNAFTRRYDSLDEKLAAFQGELSDAVERLQDDDEWLDYLNTMSKFHSYSPQNQLLIWIQKPDARHVAGYRKWQEMNRQVLKGEHGIQILAPRMSSRECDRTEIGAYPDKKSSTGYKRRVVTGFTTASVFDISQTDGDPLPEGRRDLSGEPPEGFVDDLEAAIVNQGFTVEYGDPGGAANGATSPGRKMVTVASHLSPADKASTLAHELGHIMAGHLDRLDEYHTGHDGHRGRMEVEAEAISYVLCRANGMDIERGGHHDRYISGWGGLNTAHDEVKEAAGVVSKAVKQALTSTAWSNLG